MALTITATVGSASANSYATEAEFIAYAAERLNVPSGTTVTGSSCTENEKKALLEAQKDLTNLRWKGTRVDTTQALAWPRKWVEDPDVPAIEDLADPDDAYFAENVVPTQVKRAQIELALEFLAAGTTDLAKADPNAGVISKTIDVISTTWEPHTRPTGWQRFPRILDYLRDLLDGASGGLELVRV